MEPYVHFPRPILSIAFLFCALTVTLCMKSVLGTRLGPRAGAGLGYLHMGGGWPSSPSRGCWTFVVSFLSLCDLWMGCSWMIWDYESFDWVMMMTAKSYGFVARAFSICRITVCRIWVITKVVSLHISLYLIVALSLSHFKTTFSCPHLWKHYSHFADEETKVQRYSIPCPRSLD